jgi:hypothetical protein
LLLELFEASGCSFFVELAQAGLRRKKLETPSKYKNIHTALSATGSDPIAFTS